ncbi:MAG TPA: single-stranded-DNA-specific exonuclease RecJ [Gaiellaceae bacterium]|nr:single-stranded-DNA-specific exonuclease RecJ [Gaiellaceae bacterium]
MLEATWTLRPCDPRQAAALARELDVTETTASVLVRRGYDDADRAAAFVAGEPPGHDPFLLGDMRAACERIRAAIAAGTRICVHGDYDVDGICATALAVLTLRQLGADVEWHLPSRFEEGYGVAGETLTRLAAEGCGLVLTVDCGITAVEEVREARAAGLDVVVTDHHRPGETLPDCPVVATRPSDYPFPELCGTGVVYKLAEALLGRDDERLARQLDLVALATIADVVPLVDENRALALAGLRRLATTTRPGLRALMRAARVDPATVDEGAVGFRLAPRINAAGRLGRPTAALELLLTEDEDEARRVADELEELNRERQAVEERILREATAAIEAWPEARRRDRGYVVADEGWHEGVIGIVASRLVERYHRPVVLIAGTDGDWKGSGRSIPAFDLHAGLAACAEHLERFGGHRAAAGLSIRPENVDALAAAFAAHANEQLADDDLRQVTVVDAIVPGAALTLDLCAELRRLAPFGLGNPGVTLLVAGCELNDLTAVGDGKHLRFRVSDARGPAGTAIAFGLGSQLDRFRRVGHYDVAFRLQENTWNGTTAPQLVVRRIFETPERYLELRERLAAEWRAGRLSPETEAIAEELGLEPGGPWRSLLESETFRMLLEEPPAELRRAA